MKQVSFRHLEQPGHGLVLTLALVTPEFTADDSHIIFTIYHSDPESGTVPDVWMVPVPAGEPTLLVERASAASTGPDGRGLVYAAVTSAGTSVRVRHQDGRDLEVASEGYWPRWSPDGRWIAYTTSNPEGGNGTIHVVRPDGSENRELTTIDSQVYGLCWTPDGSSVIFASEQGGPTMLWSVDVDTATQQSITRGPGTCTSPAMAPDGQRLVFSFSYRRWYLYIASESTPFCRAGEGSGPRDGAARSGAGHRPPTEDRERDDRLQVFRPNDIQRGDGKMSRADSNAYNSAPGYRRPARAPTGFVKNA